MACLLTKRRCTQRQHDEGCAVVPRHQYGEGLGWRCKVWRQSVGFGLPPTQWRWWIDGGARLDTASLLRAKLGACGCWIT